MSAYGDGSRAAARWSGASSPLRVKTSCPPPPPVTPSDFKTTSVGATSVSLRWNESAKSVILASISRYWVERSTDRRNWTTVSSDISALAYTVSGLSECTTYYFRVSAYGDGSRAAARWSRASSHLRVKTSCPPTPTPTPTPEPTLHPPGAVSSYSLASLDRGLKATWQAPSSGGAVARYEVQHKLRSSSWSSGSVADNGASLTRTITGLTNDVSYDVRVRACNAAGCSSWDSLPGTPRDPTPPPTTPPTLPVVADVSGVVGRAFSKRLPVASGGTPPYTYSTDGLPAGLTFTASKRTISGMPTKAVHESVTYSVEDNARRTASRTFTITIVSASTPSITISGLVASMEQGDSDSFTVTASNLVSSNSYSIRVKTGSSHIGFDGACSDRQEDVAIPAGRTSYSASFTLHGCDEPGGTVSATLRIGNNSIAADSQHVAVTAVTPPSTPTVSFSSPSYSVNEGATSTITVRLSRASGQRLDIPIMVSDGTAQSGDYSVSGLANGKVSFAIGDTSKTFSIRANQDTDCDGGTVDLRFGTLPTGVSKGSPSTSTLTIDDPDETCLAGLDVTVYEGRRVNVHWNAVTGATRYSLEAEDPQRCTSPSSESCWSGVRDLLASTNHGAFGSCNATTSTCRIQFSLDIISSSLNQGLANDDAYLFRLTARNDNVALDRQKFVVIDTPIYRADGDSREADEGQGEAEAKWRIPVNLPDAANDAYFVRYVKSRKLSGISTVWQLEENEGEVFTIEDLDLNNVYAMQFYYDTVSGYRVYAGRYSYVRPSTTTPATNGQRINGFPVVQTMHSREYSYRICIKTFPEPEETREAWEKVIVHALKQWEFATDKLMLVNYRGYCTGFSGHSKAIAAAVDNASPSNGNGEDRQTYSHVDGLLRNLNVMGLQGVQLAHDPLQSEVLMFEGGVTPLLPETSSAVTHSGCPSGGRMCAPGHDILIMGGRPAPKKIRASLTASDLAGLPGDVRLPEDRGQLSDGTENAVVTSTVKFNTCGGTSFGVGGNLVYEDLIHESGHALGLRGSSGKSYSAHHPSSSETVMNYKHDEPDCSPHPSDILAIYALYQTVD